GPAPHARAPAGEPLRRCEDDRQSLAIDAAVVGDLLDDRRRRRPRAFQHQRRAVRLVGVAELLEQRLAPRQRARRPRAEREERVLAFAVREPPARILARPAPGPPIGPARAPPPSPARPP